MAKVLGFVRVPLSSLDHPPKGRKTNLLLKRDKELFVEDPTVLAVRSWVVMVLVDQEILRQDPKVNARDVDLKKTGLKCT